MLKTNVLPIIAIVSIITLGACNSGPLIPGFSMGLSEQELKEGIQNKVASGQFIQSNGWDSTEFIYRWKLLDTTIYSTVEFNSDGAPYGSLRLCSIDLNDTVHSRLIPEPYETVNRQILDGEEIFASGRFPTETFISYSLCPEAKYKKVLTFLRSNYDKEDSITYRINKRLKHHLLSIDELDDPPPPTIVVYDTIYTYHHFHNANSTIILKHESIFPATKIIPYPHLNSLSLYQISNSYEADLEKVVTEMRKTLKPKDIITLPIQYEVRKVKDTYFGYDKTILALRISIGEFQAMKTKIEPREISAMKGRIIISDKFGDTLYSGEDIQLECQGALAAHKLGLQYAIYDDGFSVVHPVTYNVDLNMNHKSISNAFKRAVRDGDDLTIEFVPDVLLFADGSILK